MRKKGKEEEKVKVKEKKRKPYQKPALTMEELFEATVLACGKRYPSNICKDIAKNKS